MSEIFFLISIFFVFNLLILVNFKRIEKKILIFDRPDKRLKKHRRPVSLLGGSIILVNLYLIIFSLKLLNLENSVFDENFTYIIILLSSLFYTVGLIDDIKNLDHNKKLLFLILSVIFVIYLFPEIKLEVIKISFLQKNYFFQFSFFFMILSFALLANAMNMFDGINLQLILYTSFVFMIFIIKGFLPIFFILLLICFAFLGILNYRNQIFLGDGGAYLISAILGITFIYQYKNFNNFLLGDEVFIILIIPALDMLRLFLIRLIKKKHPFKGDLNHLHHIVFKFTKNKNLTIAISLLLSVFPTFLLLLNIKTYFIFAFTLLTYTALIIYCKARTKKY